MHVSNPPASHHRVHPFTSCYIDTYLSVVTLHYSTVLLKHLIVYPLHLNMYASARCRYNMQLYCPGSFMSSASLPGMSSWSIYRWSAQPTHLKMVSLPGPLVRSSYELTPRQRSTNILLLRLNAQTEDATNIRHAARHWCTTLGVKTPDMMYATLGSRRPDMRYATLGSRQPGHPWPDRPGTTP